LGLIPVIDLFAGPGGLSEGFSSLRDARGNQCFDVRLSIEKDPHAHRTLELRSFFRAFGGKVPEAYYDYLAGNISREALFSDPRFTDEAGTARHEAWHCELSEDTHKLVSRRVREAIGQADSWVLIGGPPCQAYSLVGRSRMRPVDPEGFDKDARHFLYREYLKIIADHAPPIFVMENVKGILSSTVGGCRIFERILSDLARPNGSSLRYRIVPFSRGSDLFESESADYVIRSEEHGVPQARHRVLLCGIREDIPGRPDYLAPGKVLATVEQALDGADSQSAWLSALEEACDRMRDKGGTTYRDIADEMRAGARRARALADSGGRFMQYAKGEPSNLNQELRAWYRDRNLNGITGHEARSHMRSDLHRYLFAASFARVRGAGSPTLQDYPSFLLPKHRNATKPGAPFADRFRVQIRGRPATTVVSHISKDGHYYIHPDPAQCRSLTVREAARLQTFPDNYHFEGNRTQQYHQVGNAVPPLLARKLAGAISGHLVREAGLSGGARSAVFRRVSVRK
jgi:DNA (cytosine-5)-methyltransferase 1